MKKLFTLLTLAVLSIGSAWAAEETVSLVSYTVTDGIATLASGNVTVILSRNGGNADGADTKSRGFRWQKTRVITAKVPTGYRIKSVKLTSNNNGNSLSDIQYTLTDGTNALTGSWDYAFTAGKKEAYTWTASSGTAYTDWVLTNSGSNGDIYVSSVTVNYEAYVPSNTAPTIISQPETTVDAYVGYETSITVGASGYPAPSYQWYSNTTASNTGGTPITGATSATYTFTPEAVGTYYYYAVVSNNYDSKDHSATSNVATVNVGLKYKVSYSAGESGATISLPLTTKDYAANEQITLPQNHYFYLDGKSLSKWSDGTNEYNPGATYTVTGDVTFVPVFADNTSALGDEETTITWTFATASGAPTYTIEGNGRTTNVIGTTSNGIDLNMDVALATLGESTGKFNNSSYTNRAQVNASVAFTIPATKGMTIKYTTTNGTLAVGDEVLFGSDKASSIDGKNYVYIYNGKDATITITDNVGGRYPSGITVTYPETQTKYQAPTIAVGDFNFENKGYKVTITASEGTLEVSTDGTNYTEQVSPYETYTTEATTYYAKVTGTDYDDSDVAEKEVINTFDSSKKYVAWVYTKGYGTAGYTFEGDPMVTALKSIYNVVEVNNAADNAPSNDLENADLIVCSEAMQGNKALSNGMKSFVGTTPMIGLKMFNYTKGRWSWGTPANPSPTATSFTPKSQLYKVLSGVTFEADGTIQLSTATSGNVVQTVEFGTTDTSAPTGNVIMGTVGDDTKAMMHAAGNYFGLGLSSDCYNSYTANAITIVKNAAAMLIAGEDLTAEAATIAITSAGWATFSCTKEVAIPEGVTAYVVSKKGEDKVTLSEIEGYIPAETGVVVSGGEGTYAATITNTGASINTTNYLVAWTTAGVPTEATYYTLAVDGNGPLFKKSSGGILAAGKAYLVLPTSGEARLSIDFDGGVTTIAAPTAIADMEAGKAEVYNLQGQRVSTPTKGLYIVGGKKVMKK